MGSKSFLTVSKYFLMSAGGIFVGAEFSLMGGECILARVNILTAGGEYFLMRVNILQVWAEYFLLILEVLDFAFFSFCSYNLVNPNVDLEFMINIYLILAS